MGEACDLVQGLKTIDACQVDADRLVCGICRFAPGLVCAVQSVGIGFCKVVVMDLLEQVKHVVSAFREALKHTVERTSEIILLIFVVNRGGEF